MPNLSRILRTGPYRYQRLVPPLPRRLRAFSVGASKSGTTSLHGLFSAHYRSGHEPDHKELIEAILAREAGQLSPAEMRQLLIRRDRRMRLEMDSSALNGIAIADYVAAFPRARFILTIRDCYSWLESYNNHVGARAASGEWQRLRMRPSRVRSLDYSAEDRGLEALGMPPIAQTLAMWAEHNQRVLEAVPDDRLLVLRTHELSASVDRIADFLGIKPESLVTAKSHSFKRRQSLWSLDQIDGDYLASVVDEHCGPLMSEFFPEFTAPKKSPVEVAGRALAQ